MRIDAGGEETLQISMGTFDRVAFWIVGRRGGALDVELFIHLLKQAAGEIRSLIAVNYLGQSIAGEDFFFQQARNSCCRHIHGGETLDPPSETIAYSQNVPIALSGGGHWPDKVDGESREWM